MNKTSFRPSLRVLSEVIAKIESKIQTSKVLLGSVPILFYQMYSRN